MLRCCLVASAIGGLFDHTVLVLVLYEYNPAVRRTAPVSLNVSTRTTGIPVEYELIPVQVLNSKVTVRITGTSIYQYNKGITVLGTMAPYIRTSVSNILHKSGSGFL